MVNSVGKIIVFSFFLSLFLLTGAYFIPWGSINWGRVSVLPAATITVTGEAQMDIKSQIAQFSAGVTVYDDDKQKAIAEVNSKVEKLTAVVKGFGIPDKDIKTQSVSISEQPEVEIQTYPVRKQPGKWMVGNTIEIKLRNVEKASALADLLSQSGATQVYGPSFSLDTADKSSEGDLLKAAIDNARGKAEVIAKAGGKRLGGIITVSESGGGYPIPLLEKAGGGSTTPIEPGTQTTSKTVTVVFELK